MLLTPCLPWSWILATHQIIDKWFKLSPSRKYKWIIYKSLSHIRVSWRHYILRYIYLPVNELAAPLFGNIVVVHFLSICRFQALTSTKPFVSAQSKSLAGTWSWLLSRSASFIHQCTPFPQCHLYFIISKRCKYLSSFTFTSSAAECSPLQSWSLVNFYSERLGQAVIVERCASRRNPHQTRRDLLPSGIKHKAHLPLILSMKIKIFLLATWVAAPIKNSLAEQRNLSLSFRTIKYRSDFSFFGNLAF